MTLFAALPPMAQATEEVMSLHVDPSNVISAGHVEAVGGVTSSGQPDAAALQVFAESGYVAVIDLRGENENRGIEDEQAVVESFGMEYVHLPITSQAAMSFENAGKLDEMIDSF
ncbi:MAG: hypothetical protein ACE5F8_09180, partial [Woeseiaceae bacterium]